MLVVSLKFHLHVCFLFLEPETHVLFIYVYKEVKCCPAVLTDAACPRGFARIKGVTCEGGCDE